MSFNMKVVLVNVIILANSVFSLQLDTDQDLLINLLKDSIRAASCVSKCTGLPDPVSTEKCMTMCRSAEEEDLCRYAWLCGKACKQACQPSKAALTRPKLSVQQSGCELSWTATAPSVDDSQQPAFVVVGTDWTGMWSVFKSGTLDSSMERTDKLMERYARIDVLAVTSAGLVAMKGIEIHFEKCDLDSIENSDHKSASSNAIIAVRDVMFVVSSVACLVFTLVTVILCLCCRQTSKNEVECAVLRPIIKEGAIPPSTNLANEKPPLPYDAVYPQIKLEESQRFLSVSEL